MVIVFCSSNTRILFKDNGGTAEVVEDCSGFYPFGAVHEQQSDYQQKYLFLLTDKRSYSAASSFAATFRCYGLGLIIGEETGGTKIFFANSIGKVMPHSGLYGSVATTTQFTACFDVPDEGIQPDLLAKPTIPQLVAQQDVALNYALLVIKKRKKLKAKSKD